MKKLALLVGTLLLSTSMLAVTAAERHYPPINKNVFAKLWNTHKDVNAIEKHGFAIVYGGKDISRSSALYNQKLVV